MKTESVRLADLLQSLNIPNSTNLPWVHSTVAANVYSIASSQRILATPCNVFKGENLCYLFVGRPAYKTKSEGEASYWQLPIVFVMRFDSPPPIKRLFPFDSGAFYNQLLPQYMTLFGMSRFECSDSDSNIGRLISFYYGDGERYFARKPRSIDDLDTQHSLGPKHQEVRAVSRLVQEHSSTRFDDRSATIEVQVASDISLNKRDLLGIIMPEEYSRDNELMHSLREITTSIDTYPIYPLNVEAYYHTVYGLVSDLYKRKGIVR